jgi:hypothetical protein
MVVAAPLKLLSLCVRCAIHLTWSLIASQQGIWRSLTSAGSSWEDVERTSDPKGFKFNLVAGDM